MRKLLSIGIGCLLMIFCSASNVMISRANEELWYEDLPMAMTAEELFGTHIFSTEGKSLKIKNGTYAQVEDTSHLLNRQQMDGIK